VDPPSPPSISSLIAEWRSRVPRWLWAAAALVAVVVVAALMVVALRAPAGPAPRLTLPVAGGGSPTTTVAGAAGVGSAGPATLTTVHAAGAVASPGVYALPAGARVADLLLAAGGALPDADLDRLNLAAKVGDGERVYVLRRGESPEAGAAAAPSAGGGGAAGTGTAVGAGAPASPIDLNTATADQLDTLPGVGPATAQAIITYRTRHGRFRSVNELLEVPGIGPAKLEAVRSLVKV